MHAAYDCNTEVFYFKNGVATISSFIHKSKVIKSKKKYRVDKLKEFTWYFLKVDV